MGMAIPKGRYTLKKVLDVVGRDVPDPGAHMYHAAEAVSGGGKYNKDKRHKIRKALARLRLKASGMTDDILGSKEVDGTMDNPYEKKPKK